MTTGGLPDATVIALRNDLLNKHNALRAHYGVRALVKDSSLTTPAQSWANYMASKRAISHNLGPSQVHGQNVAGAISTVAGVMKGWRDSCAHFYLQIASGFTKVGFGIAKASNGDYYWCTDFGGGYGPCFSNKCPGCSCTSCGTNHAFYSNDPRRPGGSGYWPR